MPASPGDNVFKYGPAAIKTTIIGAFLWAASDAADLFNSPETPDAAPVTTEQSITDVTRAP